MVCLEERYVNHGVISDGVIGGVMHELWCDWRKKIQIMV